jgi:hypothetical protein
MVRVLYYYCLPHMHRVYIQHTALLLMILGLLVVVYIFSFYPCFFQLLLFALDDSGQKISTLYALARFPPQTIPHCVYIRRWLAVVSHLPIKIMRASWDLRGPGTVQLPYAA